MVSVKLRSALRAQRPSEPAPQAWDQRAHSRIAEALHKALRVEHEAEQQAARAREAASNSRFWVRRYARGEFQPTTQAELERAVVIETELLAGGRKLHTVSRDNRLCEILVYPVGRRDFLAEGPANEQA